MDEKVKEQILLSVNKSFNDVQWMVHHGMVSKRVWNQYQWMWRHCASRFSNTCIMWEGKDFPGNSLELAFWKEHLEVVKR